jgi:mannose/fructose/N-acetylgalactosamine-specific phosphotransferase system component IIB
MKEKIIEFNKQFGLNTSFFTDTEIEGYSLKNTIYLNENSADLEKVNKHELLHFFENDDAFSEIKEKILKSNEEKIDIIRSDYYLRYCGLYTEEEIQNGIIDIEIVIDVLIGNYIFKFDQGLKIGDYVLKEITKNLEQKRYLNLSLTSQIDSMNLSKWDKLFILNFYDGKEHIFPQKEGRKERIKEDIKQELERLYNLLQDEFIINPESKDVIREYESELKALESRGEDISHLKNYRKQALEELANQFTKQLYEEYKHIVDLIKEAQYEDSFKVLMLRETLSKTYKLDTKDGKKTIVNKRNMHESIASHMTLNDAVLNLIYNNVNDYNNFANLYFAGLEIFNQTIAQKNNVSIDNVDVYEMGRWIKFDGKTTDSNNYIKNAQELSSLVKDTPWCTKTLASSQLAQGDFYVFVDNDNKPHIAVKMNGNEIDEVRGTLNGNAQELEEDYRKVAISFLENNKEIKNGDKWLKKEEWNKRLLTYIHNIENDTFKEDDVEKLIEDYIGHYEYKAHFSENTNKEKLRNLLPKIKKKIALYYNCREDEILFSDVDFSDAEYTNLKICPYKLLLGNVDFKDSPIESLGDLIIIGGIADFWNSKIQSLGNLTTIGGYAEFENSQIESLGNLTTIGGNALFRNSKIQSLGALTTIGGEADFMNSKIQSLGNLTTIGGNAVFVHSQIQSLGNLTTIGGVPFFKNSKIQSLGNLTTIGGDVEFENSPIESLGNLTTIGGSAYFRNSKIQSLGVLTAIGGSAYFPFSQVQSLGNLTTIGVDADFENSQIQSLGNLTTIGGEAVFRNSKIQSLGNLTTIGVDADFENSQIQSLDNLTTIGGDAYFINSQVQSLGNLTTIGRHADFRDSKITDFGNIEYIGRFFSNSKLLRELYLQEYDDTGHRIKKENNLRSY